MSAPRPGSLPVLPPAPSPSPRRVAQVQGRCGRARAEGLWERGRAGAGRWALRGREVEEAMCAPRPGIPPCPPSSSFFAAPDMERSAGCGPEGLRCWGLRCWVRVRMWENVRGAGRMDGTGARRSGGGRASPRDCPALPPSPPPLGVVSLPRCSSPARAQSLEESGKFGMRTKM
ncbi:hypothetical protein B0H13DRAFT_2088283, partial [Mycena leptocephala]